MVRGTARRKGRQQIGCTLGHRATSLLYGSGPLRKKPRHGGGALIMWSGHLLPFVVGSRPIPRRYCIHPRPVVFKNTAPLTACLLRFGTRIKNLPHRAGLHSLPAVPDADVVAPGAGDSNDGLGQVYVELF
jgi:hypothetical protein